MAKPSKKAAARASETVGADKAPTDGPVDTSAPVSRGVSKGVDTKSGCKSPPNLKSEGQRLLLEAPQSLRQLAELLDVSRSTVGHWRTGERVPDRDQRLKLEGHLGIPSRAWDLPPFAKSAAEAPTGPSESANEDSGLFRLVETLRTRRAEAVGGDQRDWVDWAKAELIVLQDEAEAQLARLGDLDRLVCSPLYGEVRALVLSTLAGGQAGPFVVPALPEQPETPPTAALDGHLRDIKRLEGDALQELTDGVETIRPRDVIGLTKLQLDCRRSYERLGVLSTPGMLAEGQPWQAVMVALSRALAPLPDERRQLIEALGSFPQNPLAQSLREVLEKVRHIQFPSKDYRDCPERFCLEILGFRPWSKQVEILHAVRDRKYVAIRSGQKTGKSRIMAALALWWFCVWEDGKVLFSNSTGKQLEAINWAEVTTLYSGAGRCLECAQNDNGSERPCPHSQVIDGTLLKSSRGGLKTDDLARSVLGVQAKDAEGIQGFSGAHLLILVDEASSLLVPLYQAFFGNTAAAGAKMVMVSNPTKTVGPYFDAFHRNSTRWYCVAISSLDAAKEGVPGLASLEYCQAVLEEDERGEKSPFYQVRVLGEFPSRDATAIYPVELILEAEARWLDAPREGRLVIGIDPSGESGTGDDGVFTVGRSDCVIEQRAGAGWTVDEYVRILRELIGKHGQRGEVPLVAIDADGVGHTIMHRLRELSERERCWDVVPVYFGHQALNWREYDTTGEELHLALLAWMIGGGAIPTSSKLEQELQRMQWIIVRKKRYEHEIEVSSSTRKADIRKELHRSPDRLDSLRIWAWAQRTHSGRDSVAQADSERRQAPRDNYEAADSVAVAMDPYSGVDHWSGG